MSRNFLRIPDCVKLSLTNPSLVQIKDDYEGAFKPSSGERPHSSGMGTLPAGSPQPIQQHNPMTDGLNIRIAATHAGIITRNHGFYLPDRMKKGSTSFTDNYPKPVLIHHKDHEDPVGRIIAAEYVDTSGAIFDQYSGMVVKDKFGVEVGTLTEKRLKDFVEGKMPFGMQVDTILTLLKDSLLEDGDYDGLGHIQVLANISDKTAIEKLLDGRYLTGSVGATTDKAVCSVCRQNWTDTGKCEHKPGAIYDGAKCFIIAGSLQYEEYSFVNVPADKHSKVLELNYNGIQDNVEVVNDYAGRIYEVQLGFPQYDSVKDKEEGSMEDEVKVQDSTDLQPAADTAAGTPPAIEPAQNQVIEDGATQGTAEGSTEIKDGDKKTEGADAPVVEDDVKDQGTESLEDFLTRVLDAEELSDEDEERLYDCMVEEFEVEDAKLSTEARKKLASSTFCGPNKSFPVNDCAHYTAALRLIGRYKGPGSKESIRTCIQRKGKAMGCTSAKKDAVQPTEGVVPVQESVEHIRILRSVLATLEENALIRVDILEADETKALQTIIKRMASLVGKDNLQVALQEEKLMLSPDSEKVLVDEVAKQEDLVGNLRDELAALRKEYSLLYDDLAILQDALTKEKTNVRKSKESHLSTMMILKDGKKEDRDWAGFEDAALDTELDRVQQDVDMTKITDKLGDGMSRVPTEGVEDPTDVQDKDSTQKSKPDLNELAAFEERYTKMLFRDKIVAEQMRRDFVRRMKMEGKLPQDNE